MYSEAEAHLANLDHCGNRSLRRAYLALLIAAERAGYYALANTKGAVHELQIRDAHGAQPFAAIVENNSMLFYLRRPALADRSDLAGAAEARFENRFIGNGSSLDEVRIRINTDEEAVDIIEWLADVGAFTLGYAARRSA